MERKRDFVQQTFFEPLSIRYYAETRDTNCKYSLDFAPLKRLRENVQWETKPTPLNLQEQVCVGEGCLLASMGSWLYKKLGPVLPDVLPFERSWRFHF